MTQNVVTLSYQNGVATLLVDNPPVNALSQAVREQLQNAVVEANDQEDCKAIVIACAGKTFIAGADITEFDKPPMEPHLPDVVATIENSQKPVVIALHGTALGGGFEVALAGHYRIALKGSKVGLPEVTLGLIPGAGGTQRLPRLTGIKTALDLIATGRPMKVESFADGLSPFDRIVDDKLLTAAQAFAEDIIHQGLPAKPVRARSIPLTGNEAQDIDAARELARKKSRGQEAPMAAIEAIKNSLSLSFEAALNAERTLFLLRRASPQSRAMRHAFFAERAATKYTASADAAAQAVNTVGVIGAGTMGSGIAMCFLNNGFHVVMIDNQQQGLDRGVSIINGLCEDAINKGRMSTEQQHELQKRLTTTVDYSALAEVDLVVEAAFESMDIKKTIFTQLDAVCKPGAILATNTSYLDINEIAAATARPQHVVGMHFFSPAHIMKLVEIVKAEHTDDATMVTAIHVGKQLKKMPVPVGVCYGFVGNRMYTCYGREANRLLLEGATPSQIDSAMTQWGMAMGPLAVADLSGIDIGYKARKENPNPSIEPQFFLVANTLVERGRLGRKAGAGFYRYDNGKAVEDDEVISLIKSTASECGIQPREITSDEIQQRLILALVNEGCNILQEGIIASAPAIDAIWLNGYGFPRWRGGPMCYADEMGLDKVLKKIQTFSELPGDRYWQPAPLLQQLIESQQPLATFHQR